MRRLIFVLCSTLCLALSYAQAEELRIASASDLRWVMPTLVDEFVQQNPSASGRVQVVYGSSGRLFGQIQNGAPFHIFFAADESFPVALVEGGGANGEVFAYAQGGLALWSRRQAWDSDLEPGADLLRSRGRIAIANPQHAPYGRLALAWLQSLAEWPQLENRLVYAESAAQTAHFVRSGSAEVGVLAKALTEHNEMQHGHIRQLPDAPKVQQAMVITQAGADNELAHLFYAFIASEQGQAIFVDAGFYPHKEPE
ncbi:MAG: molybdate ABC transporter substrate-binding protein [Aliidiomarina sp.]|uniref:molybdate ABC transporter substrate-binding protein n=1 Tax=Aliidiomarina sp. TaxID=1872439 RepID=UPI0025BC9454|nr:molybdate ABC transporter substrate-binding protein [Aliidiomarina sp.]MCH8501099.1 molybdate ABC transporter substrate-binding protein [Aliidiomarina sp.]